MNDSPLWCRMAQRLVNVVLSAYGGVVLVGVLASWVVLAHENEEPNPVFVVVADFGIQAAEPALRQLRPYLPDRGLTPSKSRPGTYIDWSVMVLLILIGLGQGAANYVFNRIGGPGYNH